MTAQAEAKHDTETEYLTEREAADRLRVTVRTMQRWRTSGQGPAYVRIGPRMIRYPEADIAAWQAARTFRHRAQELANGREAA